MPGDNVRYNDDVNDKHDNDNDDDDYSFRLQRVRGLQTCYAHLRQPEVMHSIG